MLWMWVALIYLAAKSANWKRGEKSKVLLIPHLYLHTLTIYKRPFVLHVDACASRLGAVLCQESDGMERVIPYASRGLSKSGRNYPAHKLEFLAFKWSLNASPPIPDWQQKADYLTTLMKQFGPSEDEYTALINIISKG